MTHCKFSTSTDGAPNDYRTHDSLNTSDPLYYLHNTNDLVYKSSSIITNDPLYDSRDLMAHCTTHMDLIV